MKHFFQLTCAAARRVVCRWMFPWVVAIVGGLTAGCDFAQWNGSEAETEKLVHHIPDHRPATYGDAVEQVKRRHAELQAKIAATTSEPLERDLKELIDILTWLPEIAADSELKKADWDMANGGSRKLGTFYEDIRRACQSGKRRGGISFQGIEPLIADLERLVPASLTRSTD